MRVFIAIQMASTLIFIMWLLYVWIKDSKFGSQPECNNFVKYVLMFANVRATETWLRVLFITYLVLSSCWMLFEFGAIFLDYFQKGIRKKSPDVVTRPSADPVEGKAQEGTTSRNTVRVRVRVSLSVVPAVYGIATLELIVQRNRAIIQPGEDAWGFGQIIALVLVSGNLIDIWMAVRERRKRKLERSAQEVMNIPLA